ncbi:hypothetical protein E2C06_32565 [Dankookia rubra]|uniref:Nucleoside hydrolase n=1 Tax=Dankookia rubra TaxID=1442381 RepID=A0A4R5Q8L2_9PROT|nr:hypothetical protein [Dankookia rubra]TDH58457.1 hypothetical protein E2C06_32565 [Dankookia rubra]
MANWTARAAWYGLGGLVLCLGPLLLPAPAAAEGAVQAGPAAAARDGRCIVVDSDGDLDDYRAVAALAPNRRVAAIVMTEGIARPLQGAGAMEAVLRHGNLAIPVIPGASADPERQARPDKDFQAWRDNAERLNGLLPAPVHGSLAEPGNLAAALRPHVRDCTSISLLVIGPWSSFLSYGAELLERVDRIVAQGRPYPDEIGGVPDGQNCRHDRDACYTAFDLLVGRQLRAGRRVRTDWVDIPNGPQPCAAAEPGVDAEGNRLFAFRPVAAWAEGLAAGQRMAPVIGGMLQANPDGWARTSLWDDLAALYLLRPDVFAARGGHLEPCVPAATVQRMLTAALEGKAP